MRPVWQRLIRFVATDGRTLYGEPIVPSADYDIGLDAEKDKLKVKVIKGSDIFDVSGRTRVTDEVAEVEKLLGPLVQSDVPTVRCIGLNYAKHIREAGRNPPPFPSLFFKPITCINDHGAPIVVPKIAQNDQADYEGELCIVIGKDAKNVPESEALDYVGGYTCGNDVSSRKLQRDPALAGGVPQWGFSKGFDTYAPLGPVLVSSDLIGDPASLHMQTKVDGQVRQDTGIDDLIFNCAYLISYLSQGSTLTKGTVIMTGTPGGVGFGMKPPQWLQPGNVVDVVINKIGTLKNPIEFE